MSRRTISALGTLFALACLLAFVPSATAQSSIGSWQSASSLTQPRARASAALLQDGRILVTGGDAGTGPTASADFISPTDGSVAAAPALLLAREAQISVTLPDGEVLVAGGVVAGGTVTNEAELFNPTANAWSVVPGGMVEARAGATATLLASGKVVIAGGDGNSTAVSSTLEVFDPNFASDGGSAFTLVSGAMSSGRENHAAALLSDGRVLIAGGSNGASPLASSDLYDPTKGTITPGPAMSVARQGFSATTLLNGLVLVAGGNNGTQDLASLELFDPAVNSGAGGFSSALTSASTPVSLVSARQGQQAVLLPHNGSVLILGGTSSGVTQSSAELFSATDTGTGTWSYADATTGAMASARSNLAAASFSDGTPASSHEGVLLALGGQDAAGIALASTETYNFPWVKTDALEYSPGSTASITGGGFQAGETVSMTLVEAPYVDNDGPLSAVADANGNFTAQLPIDAQDANVTFFMTAAGQSSGRTAQARFADLTGDGGGGGTPTPNLTVSNTHSNVSGNSWTWSITVGNDGTQTTGFAYGATVLQDDLPNTNVTYGAISGVPNGIACSIASNTLSCTSTTNTIAGFVVSNVVGGGFTISFTANASAAGAYANPRSGGICEVNPIGNTPGGSPVCADTVITGASTPQTPTITFGAAPTPTFGGGNFTASASTTNSDSSTLTYSVVSGPCALVGGSTLSSSGAGTCEVKASGAATANFSAASATQDVTIAPATPTITFGTAPTPTFGAGNFTVSASTSNSDSSALTYSVVSGPCALVSGATFSSSGAGTCEVKASGAATANFSTATATQDVTIAPAAPAITFGAAPTPTFGAGNFSVSASTSNTDSATLTYSVVSGPCALASGSTFISSGAGTCEVKASGAATANFSAASTTQDVNIAKATPTLSVTNSPAVYNGSPQAANVAGSVPGTPSSILYNGSATVPTNAGTYAVVASFAPTDGTDYASLTATAAGSFVIQKTTPTVSVSNIPANAILGGSFNATIAVSPGDDGATTLVSFTPACTVSGTSVSFVNFGTCTLVASVAEGTNYLAATGASQSFSIVLGFAGLYGPYAPPPVSFNVQRTMPLVWQYTAANGSVVNSAAASPQVQIAGPYACGGSDSAGDITVDSAGASGYQYNAVSNTWQFNWQVKGNAPGCYNIYIKNGQTGQLNGPFPIQVTSH